MKKHIFKNHSSIQVLYGRSVLRTLVLLSVLMLLFAGCGKKVPAPETPSGESSQTGQQTLTLLPEDEAEPGIILLEETEAEPEIIQPEETEAEPEIIQPEETEAEPETVQPEEPEAASFAIDEDGTYNSKDDVALYLYTYDHLPDNFITKKEARALGWTGGSLEEYAPGKSIGGDYFGNYEGQLPKKKGREYHECDIDTLGRRNRGARRIIYSTDGLIYYTGDHYETFVLLYDSDGPVE